MMRLACADNRRGDGGFGQQPRESDLRAGNSALLGDFAQAVDDLAVGLFGAWQYIDLPKGSVSER